MSYESIEIHIILPATPKEVYEAWLQSEKHSAMTGGEASCSAEEGGTFSAWDGYISGSNIRLSPYQEILQSWRTTEFADSDSDSELTIRLEAVEGGTKLSLIHTHIPAGQTQYEKGWLEHYFEPMKVYFKQV